MRVAVALTFLCLCLIEFCVCDWMTEWMNPLREQLRETDQSKSSGTNKVFDEEPFAIHPTDLPKETTTSALREKLEQTLESAAQLAQTLKDKITEIEEKERTLKEAIAQGKAGVTSVQVKSQNLPPRWYIIRDGSWSLCSGILQTPANGTPITSLTVDSNLAPKCVGKEIPVKPDPCVFNSVIKYEVIPQHRSREYVENDFLCLKPSFNSTIEQYLSVLPRVLNDTCKTGHVRSINQNIEDCGVRTIADYTYYPQRKLTSSHLPLEYCSDNGTCKLVVAWHVSNTSVENYEFLKPEPKFQKYFIRSGLSY